MVRQRVMAAGVWLAAMALVLPAVAAETEDEQPSPATSQDKMQPADEEPGDSVDIEPGLDAEEAPVVGELLGRAMARGAQEQMESGRRRLTLMLTGNIDGNFARVDCRQRQQQELYWARQAGYFDALDRFAESTELSTPVALNVGNSPFPGALGRYLTTGRDAGVGRLAEIIDEIPLAVHGVGNREFALPRQRLADFSQALTTRDIPVQAANLECDDYGGAEAICESMVSADNERPFRVVERDGVDIAVTTVLDGERLDGLSRFQHEGIELNDPVDVLPAIVEQMRDAADLVVVQHQVSRGIGSPRSYQLASEVPGIDLVVASNLIDSEDESSRFDPDKPIDGGRMAIIEASTTGTPIISANSGEGGAINVELDTVAEPDGEGWMIRRAIPRRIELDDAPKHEPTRQLLESAVDDFCRDWGDPIGDYARLARDFEMEDLQELILNVMRFSTRTEVALSNRGSFRNQRQFPLTDQLTVADIRTALPFENRLVTVDISGSVLQGLRSRLGDDVIGTGIEVQDGQVRINGRAVDADRTYRIAINDFLAEGGDGVFSAGDLDNPRYHHPSWSDEPPPVGDVVIHYVEDGEHRHRGRPADAVSPGDSFPDLHDKFLWSLLGSLNASYNQVTVENPGDGYDQNQLDVQSTDQINLEGRLAANADSRYHGWDNSLDLQYAAARFSEAEENGFEETRDRVRLRSRYRYKRLRATQQGRWFVPDPVVEGQAESEFTSPEERDWHRLNLRAIAGASFQLFDPLDVQLGLNVSQDILEPDGEPTWGINASYTLARISPLRILDRPIRVQSEVEYFYNDIGRQNIQEARSSNRVFFAIFGEFFFTTTFNAFLYRDDSVGELGTNTELTVGINYEWERAFQNF